MGTAISKKYIREVDGEYFLPARITKIQEEAQRLRDEGWLYQAEQEEGRFERERKSR